ncbi:MAG: hypothetical protein AAFN42_23750 [Cyanobacteria bacterium J06554_1]
MADVTVSFPADSGIKGVHCEKLTVGWNVYCGTDRLNQFPILNLESVVDYLIAYYEIPLLSIDIDGTAS